MTKQTTFTRDQVLELLQRSIHVEDKGEVDSVRRAYNLNDDGTLTGRDEPCRARQYHYSIAVGDQFLVLSSEQLQHEFEEDGNRRRERFARQILARKALSMYEEHLAALESEHATTNELMRDADHK